MQTEKTYTLPVGAADEDRLNGLNRLYNPYTEKFRQQYLPDLTGKTVLDIGCGTGMVACYWAKEVGPTGKVIAADISVEQLEIARKNAKQQKLSNIEFIELDVKQLDSLTNKFDLVYCRFLLVHLHEQEKILTSMVDHLNVGGNIFCEELISYDAFFADPDSAAFQSWVQLILKQPQIYDTDFYIGKKLHSIFRKLKLSHIHGEIIQPIVVNEEDKCLFYLGFTDVLRKKYADKGLATLDEIETTISALKQDMHGKSWIAAFAQTMQISGKKVL